MDKVFVSTSDCKLEPCNCIGRQVVDGKLQPACPCAMRQSEVMQTCNMDERTNEEKLRDTIASLEAELKQREWISVEDELPKNAAQRVIVSGGVGYYSHRENRWYTCMEQDHGGFYLPIQWEVKHWMKLPSPPKES